MFSKEYCKNFKKIYFEEHLETAASAITFTATVMLNTK